MHFNRFQQGDSVQYNGSKDHLRSELGNREGVVVSRVGGEDTLVCVSFGEDAYLLDEVSELAKYVKREKVDHTQEKKGPEVQKRRGVSDKDAPKGGKKRRNNQEQA